MDDEDTAGGSSPAVPPVGLAVFISVPIRLPWEQILVEGLSPDPVAAPAPDGLAQIKQTAGTDQALGVTNQPAASPPDLRLDAPVRRTNGKWTAQVRPTPLPSLSFTSLYPGPGIHHLPAKAGVGGGKPRHFQFPPDISELAKRGEKEHIRDIEWAHELAAGIPAREINSMAESDPPEADTPAEATQRSREALRQQLPPQLRWPPAMVNDPRPHWRDVYWQLMSVTEERDTKGWHSLTGAFVLGSDKAKLGIPAGEDLIVYQKSGQIDVHPSEALVKDRFKTLPTF